MVGSSAMRIFGSHEIAIAPTMRCRMPPESWCGYSRTRVSGDAMRTAFKSSVARFHALRRGAPSWTRIGSATWSPTVKSGFSDIIGSCRIIAIRLPRIRRISPSGFLTRSEPSKNISPETMRAAGGSMRSRVKRQGRLARARLAHDPERLTLVERQGDVVHRARHPGAAGAHVVRGQVPDVEERAAHSWRSCGSNFTRSQSPRRFAERTMSMMQEPGSTVSHQ